MYTGQNKNHRNIPIYNTKDICNESFTPFSKILVLNPSVNHWGRVYHLRSINHKIKMRVQFHDLFTAPTILI